MNSNPKGDVNPTKDFFRYTGSEDYHIYRQVFLAVMSAFSVPVETILRYDFGERYYSKGAYFGGFIILAFWYYFVGGITSFLTQGISLFGKTETATHPLVFLFQLFFFAYIILGLLHFFRIWYRDRTGQALHSYDDGSSWLSGVGKWLFKPLNVIAGVVVSLLSLTIPKKLRIPYAELGDFFVYPVAFSKRVLEPLLVLIMGCVYFSHGYILMSIYFFFAAAGLVYRSNLEYLKAQGLLLDLRDQVISKSYVNELSEHAKQNYRDEAQHRALEAKVERVARQVKREARQKPEMVEQIKADNPTLFDMMEQISPGLRNITQSVPPSETTIS